MNMNPDLSRTRVRNNEINSNTIKINIALSPLFLFTIYVIVIFFYSFLFYVWLKKLSLLFQYIFTSIRCVLHFFIDLFMKTGVLH